MTKCPQCNKPIPDGRGCSCRFLSDGYLSRLDRLHERALSIEEPECPLAVRDSIGGWEMEVRILFPNGEGEDD